MSTSKVVRMRILIKLSQIQDSVEVTGLTGETFTEAWHASESVLPLSNCFMSFSLSSQTPEKNPSPWVSKRPRDPSPSEPNCSPFRSSGTQSFQPKEPKSPKGKSRIEPGTTLSEDEFWKDDYEDKPKPKISSPRSARHQRIIEGLNEDDSPPRKRQRIDSPPVHTQRSLIMDPKPSEQDKPATSHESDNPFLVTSTPASQKFTLHGENLSTTSKSVNDTMDTQDLLQALEDNRKNDEDILKKLAANISRLERRHVADTKSIEFKLKLISNLQSELKEQKQMVAALRAEKESSIVGSSPSRDLEATLSNLKDIITDLKRENESLRGAGFTKYRNNGAYSQP
ncbi:hypothetical protein CPB86DRAFT_838275 [Serendipita vermifera]|nr:hypothetical protein CPB86DRAFT_838275 [Serendipita vermifera]